MRRQDLEAFDKMPFAFFAKDEQGVYVASNPVVHAMAGEPVLGKTDRELMWAADAQRFLDSDREAMRSGQPLYHTVHMDSADHGPIDENVCKFAGDLDGTRCVFGIAIPLSHEESPVVLTGYEEANLRHEELEPFRHMPFNFWAKDESGRYLWSNKAVDDYAGESVIGKSDLELRWAEDAAPFRTDDQEVLNSGTARLFIEHAADTARGEVTMSVCKFPGTLDGRRCTFGVSFKLTEAPPAEQAA